MEQHQNQVGHPCLLEALTIAALSVAALVGCTGTLSGTDSGNRSAGPNQGVGPGGVADPGGGVAAGGRDATGSLLPAVGPAGLRRLTTREYDNTVRDLLGDDSGPSRQLVAESHGAEGYVAFQPMGATELEQYRSAAEAIAARAVGQVADLVPCASGTAEPICTRAFIDSFGKRAFRRPLAAAEATELEALYTGVRMRAGLSHSDGIRVLLTAMLQDPRFLYQRQLGSGAADANGLVPLDAYDMASRLSYALWRTMPDAALLEAADSGRLGTEAEVRAQATRMLADPRAREATTAWASSWLGLERLDTLSRPADAYPEWTPALGAAMRRESEAFVASVVLDGDAALHTLLTAPVAFPDAALSQLYGVAKPTLAGGLSQVNLNPTQRAGILTQASFLTAFPTPVLRGKFVRERLLCQTMPPPPPNAQGMGHVLADPASERERVSAHSTDPACAGCHTLMDPIGFGFLSFDAIGKWRESDAGRPIDDSGALAGTDADGSFVGPVELAARLASSADVRQCLTRRWFRSLLERAETDSDNGSLELLGAALEKGERPMRDMLLALVAAPAFRYRHPLSGEATP